MNEPTTEEKIAFLQIGQATIKEEVQQIRADFANFQNEIRAFMNAQSERSRMNWPVICSILGVFFIMCGGAWYVIQLQTQLEVQSKVTPIANSVAFQATSDADQGNRLRAVEGQTVSLLERSTRSETDRGAISRDVGELKAQVAEIESDQKAFQSSIKASLLEIETQFAASDQSHNVQWANSLRWIALLWKKSYEEPFPSEIQFYPNISQHDRP